MTTRLYSNELKALVVPESILEQPNVLQEKCLTIQWMNYKCQRERNNRGLWSHATSGDGVHHPTERYC